MADEKEKIEVVAFGLYHCTIMALMVVDRGEKLHFETLFR